VTIIFKAYNFSPTIANSRELYYSVKMINNLMQILQNPPGMSIILTLLDSHHQIIKNQEKER